MQGETATFVIGENRTAFVVPLKAIENSKSIMEDRWPDNQNRTIIIGRRWQRIPPRSFEPIAEYLRKKNFWPYLANGRFKGLGNDIKDHGHEIIVCGQVFKHAREMELTELMLHVCNRLEALKKEPGAVLIAAQYVFKEEMNGSDPDRLMRTLLINEIAANYPIYMVRHAARFFQLQKKAPDFGVQVLQKYLTILQPQIESEGVEMESESMKAQNMNMDSEQESTKSD